MDYNFKNGNFYFSGHNTLELVDKYQTPLYVMSQDIIEEQINRIKRAFNSKNIDYKIYYAGKSFINKGMCILIDKNGLYLDTVSGGEIFTALEAGFPATKIAFHGSNKTDEEIIYAIENGIGLIIVDSESELKKVNQIAKSFNKKIKILLRINPGVEAHTHELINTGKIDTKFGIPFSEVNRILNEFKNYNNLILKGFHCHIGSQIIEEKPFLLAAEKVLKLFKTAQDLGLNELDELNLGGGFGIAYTEKEIDFIPEEYIPKLIDQIDDLIKKNKIKFPILSFEPGRYISAPAGITLYTVGTIKEIPGIRDYLSVDGGLTDNPRPALYEAEYEALICNRELTQENARKVRISGRACESDQIF